VPSRIAFSTLAFPDATLAAAASAGRRWGYSGIELRLVDGELIDPAISAAGRARVRRTLAAAGLPVVAVDSSIRLTGEDPGPELHRFLQLASDLAAPLVRVFGGALDPPPARQDRLRDAARVLEEAVPLAARLGVAIGVETHDAFSASSVVAELLALLSAEGVPSDLVGAVWDSHHPHRVGETPAEVYANLSPRILLAQVKDARRAPDGEWQLVLLGAGEVPVREMLGLLTAGGYPHWISVEWEKRWHPEIEAPEVALPQHLDLLAAWLESGR
jgi:sugar phosphate isomerase/epimerase